MQETPPDVALTVALAEYAELQDLRRRADDGSSARFNYFIAIAAAGTTVTVGLLSIHGQIATARVSVSAAVGAIVLLLGVVSFDRMVYYRVSRAEYTAALNALRTYLLTRAPDVAPYVLLPTIDRPADAPTLGAHLGRSLSRRGLASQ